MTKTKGQTAAAVPKAKAAKYKRKALLKVLGPEARQHVHQINEWFAREGRNTLESRYRLGTAVRALFEDQSDHGKRPYGHRLVARLSEVFGWDKGVIYNALAFVRTFDWKDVTRLMFKPMADGRIMPYGYLLALTKVPDKADRERLLNEAATAAWTRDEIQAAIGEVMIREGKAADDGRGRPLKVPLGIPALLRQQERAAGEFVRRAEKVWKDPNRRLTKQVKQIPRTEATEEELHRLEVHLDVLRKLAEKANEQVAETEQAVAILRKKLESGGPETKDEKPAASRPTKAKSAA